MLFVKILLLRKNGGLITNFGVIRQWSFEPDFTVCHCLYFDPIKYLDGKRNTPIKMYR